MGDTSIDFDTLLDDDDFELPDEATLAQLESQPPPLPPPSRPPPARPPPARTILRPPKPPARLVPPSSSTSTSQAPPAKKPRLYGQAAGGRTKQWVPANPFHARGPPAPPPPALEVEEEEMPEIRVVEGEGEGEGGYAATATASVGARDVGALRRWGAGGDGQKEGQKGEREQEGESEMQGELRAMREERDRLQATLLAAESRAQDAERNLMSSKGEISIVRKRLDKSEAEHTAVLREEARVKEALQEKMAKQEKEHRKAMESMKVEDAFRRQEIETSARRPSASQQQQQWSTRRSASQAPGLMGPPAVPGSPSVGRGGRGSPLRVGPTPKSFGGFKNAFGVEDSPSASASAARGRARVPLAAPALQGGPLFGGAGAPQGKGRGLMLVQEEREDERMVVDGEGEGEEGWEEELREEEGDEDEGMMSGREGRDWRGEIISAIFTHTTTYHHLDAESSTAPLGVPGSSRAFNRSTSTSSLARSTFTSTRYASHSHSTGRLSLPSPAAAAAAPTGPIPTFHALTNLRFLPQPAAGTTLAMTYEESCRELFSILGRSSAPPSSAQDPQLHLREFVDPLARCLEGMACQLEKAGLVGPLVQLLALISHLILLFPAFSLYFLGGASGLLPLLARVLRRFGRPPVPGKGSTMEDASSSSSSSSSLAAIGKGLAKERSRRVRGVVMRPLQAVGVGAGGKKGEAGGEERVELEGGKRGRLMSGVVECLEGLAWGSVSGSGEGEEVFVALLEAKDAIATALDPNQPPAVLISTIRFLSLLACRPSLFRHIVAVKFYDASDVRGSKVPIFDRVGSLLVRNGSRKGSVRQIFTLDACLISFITILATKHEDAILFLSTSPALIPELLEKVFKDTRTVWEFDGGDLSVEVREVLRLTVQRLSSTVHLFYYLLCSPSSTLKVGEFFTQSSFLGLHDRFNVAFGMLSFAGLPDWAEEEGEEEVGRVLVELGYLAQEIMEDVSPQEADEMERCFATAEEEEEAADDGLAGGEGEGGEGKRGERMELDGVGGGGEGDEEMLLRDLSQG